jgi:UDP-GlcNAc:undecaprenyl-phosphate GlcNAc-1-phosphate transferase
MKAIASCVAGFAITLLLLMVLRPLAHRIGLADQPGGRKHHDGRVPLIGGIAMLCGFVFVVLILDVVLSPLRALFAGCGLLMIVGVLDDFRELSTFARFLAQIVAALIMVYFGGVRLHDLGHLVSDTVWSLGLWEVPFTVFAVVGVINALNMADGLDGLAGTLTLIALATLAALASAAGRAADAAVLLVLVSTVVAFLALNLRIARPRALIFMGDAGSMFLGFAIAWFCISLSQRGVPAMTPVTALWVFALPLFDTVSLMLRRIVRGRSPFAADREHFHHILLAAGYTVNQSLAIIGGIGLTLAATGAAGYYLGIPERLMFLALMGLFALYFWGVMHAWRVMKALRRGTRPLVAEMLLEGQTRGPGAP